MDRNIWQALVDLQPRIRRFAFGLCNSMDEADELVQMAYERALSRSDQFQAGTRLDSWMFRIVHSIRINRYHADRVRGSHLRPVDPDTLQGADQVKALESSMTLASVRRFMQRLPEDQRAALLLVAVEGLSYRDAAEALGVPMGTVTSRVARARMTLKEMIDHGIDRAALPAGVSP